MLWFIDKMSCSIYLVHYVATYAFTYFGFVKEPVTWVARNIVLAFALALISYYGVEIKFMALNKGFGSNIQTVARPQGAEIVLQQEKPSPEPKKTFGVDKAQRPQ